MIILRFVLILSCSDFHDNWPLFLFNEDDYVINLKLGC
jgi:hypothetical protein